MIIAVRELETTLACPLSVDRPTNVEALRLNLYRHQWPAGKLYAAIYLEGEKLTQSEPVEISDIGSAPYFHGFVRFSIDCGLKKSVQYEVRLESTDYEFNESAFIGWKNQNVSHPISPLDIEIFERTQK